MAPLRTLLPALGLWLLQAGQAHARAQGYAGADHPFQTEPNYDPTFSFGHQHPISLDGGKSIKNFEILGSPQILSDRVLLTPPQPGNQRSAIWSTVSNHNEDWELHVPFRVSGGERSGGSLQIWYTHRGAPTTGTSTIYSAKPFEGLAIVIDSSSGSGNIRGYLNDGSTDYSIHHHTQSLAFGQCNAVYRNLGRLSDLKVYYKKEIGLKVLLDDHLCFETNKVQLPSYYRWGISAASAENPDSFEVFGFKVHVDEVKLTHDEIEAQKVVNNEQQDTQRFLDEERQRRNKETAQNSARMAEGKHKEFHSQYEYKDEDAKAFKDNNAQFSDLHLRMQAMTHQIAEVQKVTGEISYTVRHLSELIGELSGVGQDNHGKLGVNLGQIHDRINHMEKTFENFERSLRHEGEKINQLRDHHENLPNHIKDAMTTHGPRMGFSISILIVFQVMLAIAYVFYKRRKNMAPKKYL
ncbi:hypothetical protein TWF694_000566 [Orbilia ellipsospora]|uniref:L-type lectin-like domain-containing protein n=1 Tax=Orbilia ellipsospora TaxID=2528407 RepID=A0AAV9XPB5_9PEZI